MSRNRQSTTEVVLATLIKSNVPLNLYQLAKHAKMSHQRIKYALPKLISDGLVVSLQNGRSKIYSVQNIHFDPNLIETLLPLIEPLIKMVYTQLDLSQAMDEEEALANNVAFFIGRQVVKLK